MPNYTDIGDPCLPVSSSLHINNLFNGHCKCYRSDDKSSLILTHSGFYPAPEEWFLGGRIVVQSGVAGFFINKPTFTPETLENFKKFITEEVDKNNGVFVLENAFFALFKKDIYNVYGIMRNGQYIALKIGDS